MKLNKKREREKKGKTNRKKCVYYIIYPIKYI